MTRKTMWTTVLAVVAFTAIYLYYVQQERKDSIRNFSSNPQPGDIYKIRKRNREDGNLVLYLKIKDIGSEAIYFYRSRLVAGALHDNFLKHFDTSTIEVYSKNELAEIIAGKWKNAAKEYTEVVEIERN